MGDHESRCPDPDPTDLFAWQGGTVVLFAEWSAGRWTLARGWRQGDRLSDVRRWSFASPRLLAGQVRRLAHEATDEPTVARAAGAWALAWAESALASATADWPLLTEPVTEPPAVG